MGKNTLIRKILGTMISEFPHYEKLIPHIRGEYFLCFLCFCSVIVLLLGNIGFVFTNDSLNAIRDILVENKLPAPARAGAIAQCDVTIPAGPTGMPPEKTSFFQALNIATKIARGIIEIISDVHLLTVGDKVNASQADLLNKMNIFPFSYGLKVVLVFEDGLIYPASILDITKEELLAKFSRAVSAVASVSLAIGYPTAASIPHSIINGFKNLLAVALATDITFDAAERVKQMLATQRANVSAGVISASQEELRTAGNEEEPVEKEESDIDLGAGGLFGSDDDF
jgi:large subunit ribosomal protein LP0